ncbi:hypothetical protein EIP91_005436 [Steccherinum ochraceum]|uniref:Uncharacterized protein n=1 Tax=Steccherinum ochraceum TaxID=92696 RepID=A0A4R0RRX6_9APHY|nr:hypothetical protein EIP91_005436 [Steccherinum ochraceum]
MPTSRSLHSSPVFHNKTNRGTGEEFGRDNKAVEHSPRVSQRAGSSQPPLFASSSCVTNASGARSPRSPPVEDEGNGVSDLDQHARSTSNAAHSDLWITPVLSEDTSSWRPDSSESTLASDSTSSFQAVAKPATRSTGSSTSIDDAEQLPGRLSSLASASSDLPSGTSESIPLAVLAATASSHPKCTSSDPLGFFSSSSSSIPSFNSLTTHSSDSLFSVDTAGSSARSTGAASSENDHSAFKTASPPRTTGAYSRLPGAANFARCVSEQTDTDEEPPAKRRRRGSTDSSLPPSDIIFSPTTTGELSTPSLPTISSPAFAAPIHSVARPSAKPSSRAVSEMSEDVSSSSQLGPRRVSARIARPVERGMPRSEWGSSSSIPLLHTTTRRSARNPQYHPLGPRHLEYDYHVAHEELKSATIRAAQSLQYPWPKRKGNASGARSKRGQSSDDLVRPTLAMILHAKFPDVERARKLVNEADERLQEALERGETWDNTPVPEEILAQTYQTVAASMPPPPPPLPLVTWPEARLPPVQTVTPTPRASSTPRPTPPVEIKLRAGPARASSTSNKASLAYKPKAITGKRRRVVLSSEVDSERTDD